MAFVYILKSLQNNITYVGSTTDLKRRLSEHNSGRCNFTKNYLPWELLYKEEFEDLYQARMREKYFKSCVGRKFIKNLFQK